MDASTSASRKSDPEYYRLDGALRDAGDLERRVRARRAVVDGNQGRGQRQPRLRRHEHDQRDLAVQPVARSATSSRWSARRGTLEPGNGYTDWNVSWTDWLAGSALQTLTGCSRLARASGGPGRGQEGRL